MRTFLLALGLFFASLGAACGCTRPVLVSGFDDVMRQADNTGLLRAARRLLVPDVTYAGMPQLYQRLTCPRVEPRMYVVSALTSALEGRARTFVARAGFPAARLHFRSWLRHWSQERFKRARIEQLLSAHAGRTFIFVLDDSETSVRLSRSLLHDHPSRIDAIYLRATVGRDLPQGATSFVTAFDIAASEAAAGRMTAGDAGHVAAAVLAAARNESVIPAYSSCPTTLPPCPRDPAAVLSWCERVRSRVLAICTART